MVPDVVRVYGSILVFVLWAIGGCFTIALFVSTDWLINTIGLIGLGVLWVGMMVLAILSFVTDLPGNAREAFE